MSGDSDLLALAQAVTDGDEGRSLELTRRALDAGLPPAEVIEAALLPGIRRAGELWEAGDYFLPELVASAQAMKAAMAVVQPLLSGTASGSGRVVIGTVRGDIHDIGKSLVATLLAAHGYEVLDLGSDVPVERFVEAATARGADLVCASALLTTTMTVQRDLVAALRAAGSQARVMVGGAPVTGAWAAEIGAHGYADSAASAVAVAARLLPHAR